MSEIQSIPPFTRSEFQARLARIQDAMQKETASNNGVLDAIVVTTPENIRYLSGFTTEFWQSPTRPWFIVIPAAGDPIAVIPNIGKEVFKTLWIDRIETWQSPNPDDEGISLLANTVMEITKEKARIGFEMGAEMPMRLPISDFQKLQTGLQKAGIACYDATSLIWRIRNIKSDAEIARIKAACQIASKAYAQIPEIINIGMTARQASRKMKAKLLELGVDATPFLALCAGTDGVEQIISGAPERIFTKGDLLFIDTGATVDGYFCDFDRNFSFGSPKDETISAYGRVWDATQAGLEVAKPGATTYDLYQAMMKRLDPEQQSHSAVGRLGHGLGLQLTEPPSVMGNHPVTLEPGMVMTIEPGFEYGANKQMVHEENIVITETGYCLLTQRAAQVLPIID